jgi:hypothetical protein
MIITMLIGLLTVTFIAYFLHLFFLLNRAERKLQDALSDIEASMLQRYGPPKTAKPADESVNKRA